jgi:hypothetical protein
MLFKFELGLTELFFGVLDLLTVLLRAGVTVAVVVRGVEVVIEVITPGTVLESEVEEKVERYEEEEEEEEGSGRMGIILEEAEERGEVDDNNSEGRGSGWVINMFILLVLKRMLMFLVL